MGREAEAQEAFRELLGMRPTPAEAYELREAIGRSQMVALLAEEAYREEIRAILELSYEYFERLREDAERVQEFVAKLTHEDHREVWRAIHYLERIGPFAVPYLLEPLSSLEFPDEEARTATIPARIVLKNMGRRATPPLVQALKARTVVEGGAEQRRAEMRDAHMKMEICRLFAASRDVRAKAPLQALVESERTNPLVREEALKTLKVFEVDTPDAKRAYLELARLYMDGDPRVVETVSTYDRVVWRWKEAPYTPYEERLVFDRPPTFLYPSMMAQQVMLDAMNYQRAGSQLLALYVANNYMLLSTAQKAHAAEELPEQERAAAAERAEEFAFVAELNEQLGAPSIHRALQRALDTDNLLLALDCIEGLRAVGDPRPTPESVALFRALESRYPNVRFAAAEAIMNISPRGKIAMAGARPEEGQSNPSDPEADEDKAENSEVAAADIQRTLSPQRNPRLVAATMYSLLEKMGRRRVLVVTGNRGLYNEVSEILKAQGHEPEMALESTEAIRALRRPMPSVDILIADVASELDLLFRFVRRDIRMRRLPVVVLSPEEDAARAQEAHEAPVVAYTEPHHVLPIELEDAIAQAKQMMGQDTEAPSEELLRRSLDTLADVPVEAPYPLDMLVPVLLTLVEEMDLDIGVKSLQVLQGIPDMRAFAPAMRLFVDEEKDLALRVEAGRVASRLIHRLDGISATRVEQLEELSLSEEEGLRKLAIQMLAKAPVEIEERLRTAKSIAEKHIWRER